MSDRKIPFGVTLTCCAVLCAFFWVMTFLFPIYVGAAALVIGTICVAIQLAALVRRAFAYEPEYLSDYVSGKTAPLVKAQPRTPTGQFASKREVIHAALRRDVEAK